MSLRVFTDNVVYDMTNNKVTALAAESKQIRREREELQMQLEKLRMGLAVCLDYKPRESSGSSTHYTLSDSLVLKQDAAGG